ncbi:hypothetical protein [Dyella sedimenti]|uniref:hypothetical protein n=1 Tax=Dyella sedimenti TaxID=2919947 RepID=UPI001FAACD0C|nr:hypothetical protein [Dyella sedimenti]
MTRHLFRHLRRCRALFALALCAWLALGSVAWAMPVEDCCASMGPDMAQAMAAPDHAPMHGATLASDTCCAHAAAQVPPSAIGHVQPVPSGRLAWQRHRIDAPQPVYDPPLRPPVA